MHPKSRYRNAADLALGALAAAALGAVLAACNEIPQDASKPFVADGEAKAAAPTLTERALYQDDYRRIQDYRRTEAAKP